MTIVVINSGSTAIKYSGYSSGSEAGAELRFLFGGELTGMSDNPVLARYTHANAIATLVDLHVATPMDAVHVVLNAISESVAGGVDAIGYRVVHPGAKLRDHQRITDVVLRDLDEAVEFAPLHDPAVLVIIRECMARFPDVRHYACFDTIFHQTMPEAATTYPIPQKYREDGARRYGFHGLSCESIVQQFRLGTRNEIRTFPHRMVIAHLGSGCSVTALLDGRSVDTTMGLTPTGGVVMGTRPGDLDPGLILYMLRTQTTSADACELVEADLNHASGIAGISNMSGGVKAVRAAAERGDALATLALKVFTRSVTKAIGGFCWLLGGLDAVVFTGGIGQHDPATRAEILAGLQGLGLDIDERANCATEPEFRSIGAAASRIAAFVAPSREDQTIASHVARMAQLS